MRHVSSMNPSTFSGNFSLIGNTANVQSKKNSTCRLVDILDFFFIAHPESGRNEGKESERVFYFNSPKNESVERQTQITGFAEAVVNFTGNFTEEEDDSEFAHRYVHTSKQSHVYILVESGKFIMGVGLNKELSIQEDYVIRGPAIKSVLVMAYRMFRLFFGSFSRLMASNPSHLKDRLEYFFLRYLPQVRLNRMPLLDLLCGVDYLSLDSMNFLRVENFLDDLLETFPQILKTAFFYQERLITYSISKADLPVLCRYLKQNLFSKSMKEELQPERIGRRESNHQGKFLTGSVISTRNSVLNDYHDAKLPVVYLYDDDNERKLVPHELIVYRALNATVCMFVQKNIDSGYLKRLDDYLGPELSTLASHIGDSYSILNDVSMKDNDFHFVYYNPESMSLKTSFAENTDSTRNSNSFPLSSSIYKSVCDAFDEFLTKDDFTETTVKLEVDWWISIKKVNKRFLLLILRNAILVTPADVQQYVNNIIKTNFDSIFLF